MEEDFNKLDLKDEGGEIKISNNKISEGEEEEGETNKDDEEIENLMCDAQDAYFEQRYDEAIKLSETVVKKKPKESSSYELMINCYLLREEYEKISSILKRWKSYCGESTNNLYHTLKVAYMLEQIDDLEECLGKFSFLLKKTKEEDLWMRGILMGVAFCADLGFSVDDKTYSLAVDKKNEESYPILKGWIEMHGENLNEGVELLIKIASDEYNQDAPLAASLLDLFFYENELDLDKNQLEDFKIRIGKLVDKHQDSIHLECTKRLKNSNTEEGFIHLNKLNTIPLHHIHKKRIYDKNKSKEEKK